jgi:hypothetical protein
MNTNHLYPYLFYQKMAVSFLYIRLISFGKNPLLTKNKVMLPFLVRDGFFRYEPFHLSISS